MPFSNDFQRTVYEPFIDYETGRIKKGTHYFKPLSRTIMQYVDHLEHKFSGEVGILEMPQKEAERRGVGRSTFQAVKQRIREGKKINWETPAVKRLSIYS